MLIQIFVFAGCIISLVIVFLVLSQGFESGSGIFRASTNENNLMSVREQSTILTKATGVAFTLLIFNSLVLGVLVKNFRPKSILEQEEQKIGIEETAEDQENS